MAAVFVRRQRRLPHPLLDLSMFGDRTFSSALGLFFVTAMVGTGTLLLVTLYLQNVTGLTPLKAGLLLLVPNVLMIIGNLVTPSLANRVRPAYLIAGGLLVAGVGYTLFVLADSTSGPETVFIAMCVVMLGTAPLAALCNHLAMGAVPADKAAPGRRSCRRPPSSGSGSASPPSARSEPRCTGAAWRTRSARCRPTWRTPPGRASTARSARPPLPAGQSEDLLAAARDAFTSGVHVVGLVSAVIYAVLAVLAVWAFRRVRNASGGGDGVPEDEDTATGLPEIVPASGTEGGGMERC